MFTTHTTVSLNSQFNMRWKQGERNCRLLRWFNKTQFLYQCVHPIHEATVFSIRMLLHFSDIVPRVCTSVLFIICTIFMPICVQIHIFCTHTCPCTHTRTRTHTHTCTCTYIQHAHCRRKIATVLQEIQQYQNTPYCIEPEPAIQKYIHAQDPHGSMTADQWQEALFEQSRIIEPKDQLPKKAVS